MALPKPDAAPVMMATLFSRRMVFPLIQSFAICIDSSCGTRQMAPRDFSLSFRHIHVLCCSCEHRKTSFADKPPGSASVKRQCQGHVVEPNRTPAIGP